MTLEEIKYNLSEGDRVFYGEGNSVEVIKDSKDQYFMQAQNGHLIGLTWDDGVTLNGNEDQFRLVPCRDLFEHIEEVPQEVRDILDSYTDSDSYEILEEIIAKIEPLGYTFTYYLSAEPYNLRKI